jgi:hypothetical protein
MAISKAELLVMRVARIVYVNNDTAMIQQQRINDVDCEHVKIGWINVIIGFSPDKPFAQDGVDDSLCVDAINNSAHSVSPVVTF